MKAAELAASRAALVANASVSTAPSSEAIAR